MIIKKRTDNELMHRLRKGDKDAFTELYNRYSARLFNFFFRMLNKDQGKAEDFTHDFFLKIIENPGKFDSDKRFDTWAFHIAYNMCKNEYSKISIRDEYRQNHGSKESVSEEPERNPYDTLRFSEALDHQLSQLDEKHRMVFLLRYQQEIPIREIAGILDCPEGTVKSRLFNAIRILSKQLVVFDSKLI